MDVGGLLETAHSLHVRGFNCAEMGATDCRDIIGFVLGSEGGPERYAQGGFKEGKCRMAVEAAITSAIQACGGSGISRCP